MHAAWIERLGPAESIRYGELPVAGAWSDRRAGVHVNLDTSGHQDLASAVELLAHRGRIAVITGLGADVPFPVGKFYTRDAQLLSFIISTARVGELADAATRINQLLAEGALAPRRIEALPLSAMAEAQRRLETGQARGTRLVLRPKS